MKHFLNKKHLICFFHLIRIAAVSLLLLSAAFLCSTVIFSQQLHRYTLNTAQQLLQNSIQANSVLVRDYLNQQLNCVRQAASELSGCGSTDLEQTKKILMDCLLHSDFIQLWLVTPDKQAVSLYGDRFDLSQESALEPALLGDIGFSKLYPITLYHDNRFFVYAPIRRSSDAPAKGTVLGVLSAAEISRTLTLSDCSPNSRTAVFQPDGTILYSSAFNGCSLQQTSHFENSCAVRCRTFPPHPRSMPFGFPSKHLIFTYRPVGISNWYIYQEAPVKEILSAKMPEHTHLLTLCAKWMLFSVFILLLTILFVFCIQRKFKSYLHSLTTINQSLELALKQASLHIYLYDFASGSMCSCSGSNELGYSAELKNGPYALVQTGAVAPEYADEFLTLFQQIRSASHKLQKNILMRRDSCESYSWNQMTLTPFSESGKTPAKALVTFEDISEKLRHEKELRLRSYQDALTGLFNRSGLHSKITELAQNASSLSHSAFLLIDLDHFKEVNDTLGHPTGDFVLQKIAQLLLQLTNENNCCVRLGGDEFAILLINSSWQQAELLAQRICTEIPLLSHQLSLGVSIGASIGIHLFDPKVESIQQVYCKSDAALYQAKTKRGCWVSTRGTV